MEALKECFSNHESLIAEAAFRIHKISINILTSGLEHDILQWQNELEKLPKPIQDQLLSSVEDMFCPLFLTHLRWSQPNDWKLKYFTLLFHRALNFEEDLANSIVDKIPNYLKNCKKHSRASLILPVTVISMIYLMTLCSTRSLLTQVSGCKSLSMMKMLKSWSYPQLVSKLNPNSHPHC